MLGTAGTTAIAGPKSIRASTAGASSADTATSASATNTRTSPELCLILGDGVDQAADFTSRTTSISSGNFTPLMTFDN